MKEKIIVSGINIYQGGPVTILKSCLDFLEKDMSQKYQIIALVHDKTMFNYDNIELIEFPKSRKSWIARIYYEFFYFRKLSHQLNPLLWFSLHDISPNVTAKIKAVYCHNPSPFYKVNVNELFADKNFFLFSIFYRYLYGINISTNKFVIVQQEWLREKFNSIFKVKAVIVAHFCDINSSASDISGVQSPERVLHHNNEKQFVFFYPAFPRIFKNIEVVCEAAKHLCDSGINNFKIKLTIDGSENKYSQQIFKKYSEVPNIDFIGIQSYLDVQSLYQNVDCLVFPSKLETWGLPLTEFKQFNKCIICSNLPYAHETIGKYSLVKFFEPDNPIELAIHMSNFIKGGITFDGNTSKNINHPFTQSWNELFNLILKDDQ
jgi:glycosyltransferase involved in cell wall biosynthesis